MTFALLSVHFPRETSLPEMASRWLKFTQSVAVLKTIGTLHFPRIFRDSFCLFTALEKTDERIMRENLGRGP